MSKKIISIVLLLLVVSTVFAGTANAAASAKVFSSSQSTYYTNCGGFAIEGFDRLGYTTHSSLGGITKSSMLSWIGNTGNGYAMYVHTVGGTGYFMDYYGNTITSANCSGNWDFVYLDSSNSAVNANFANAFHTTGYSNRCFLGWNGTITFENSNTFNYYFWLTYISYTSVRLAAISAATHVPGSGTSPTKLYGSTTYTGAAR